MAGELAAPVAAVGAPRQGWGESSRSLFAVLEVLIGAVDRTEIVAAVTAQARDAIGASKGALWLVSADGEHLELESAVGVMDANRARFARRAVDRSWPMGCAALGEAVWCACQADYTARFPEAAAATATSGSEIAFAALPVWTGRPGSAVSGALAYGFERRWEPTVEERELLQTLARLCAVALERIELAGRAEADRRRLEEVLRQLPCGVLLVDGAAARVELANEAGQRLLARLRGSADGGGGEAGLPPALDGVRPVARGETVRALDLELPAADATAALSLRLHAAPVRDRAGAIVAGVAVFDDVTAERRSERVARLLEETSALLANPLDFQANLRILAQRLVPSFADWCEIHLLDEAGAIEPLAVVHSDPQAAALVLDLRRQRAPTLDDSGGVGWVIRRGEAELMSVVDTERLQRRASSIEELRGLRRSGVRSSLVVPLGRRGSVAYGAIAFADAESGRRFDERDQALALELAHRATCAIEHARAFAAEKAARADAERLADQRARLQRVSAALAEVSTPREVAEVVAGHAVSDLGPCAVTVAGCEDGRRWITVLATSGACRRGDPRPGERVPLDESSPVGLAVRSAAPRWGVQRGGGEDSCMRGEPAVWAAYPLASGCRLLGAAVFYFAGGPPSVDDREYLGTLARLCAQALERAQLLEREQAARRAAEAANRSKDAFLADLSHELRTPLSAMLGWAQLLREGRLDGEMRKRAEAAIEQGARQQARLIDDLLDVSRVGSGKLRLQVTPTLLSTVVEAALEAARPAVGHKSLTLTTHLEPTVRVLADPTRLQQVVGNLITNAIKFTPTGGRIEVRVERIDGDATLTVVDTGSGIAGDFLPYVFDRFRQADGTGARLHGGLGLGLALARDLVALHGGVIVAASDGPGRGSRFEVTLPLLPERIEAVFGELGRGPRVDGLALLLVDGDPASRRHLAQGLRLRGVTVWEAPSHDEAESIFNRCRPDVFVSDLGRGEQDGCALLRRLRAAAGDGAPVPAIALIAERHATMVARCLDAGYQRCLEKPIPPPELLRHLVELTQPAAAPMRAS